MSSSNLVSHTLAKLSAVSFAAFFVLGLSGCAPEVGSDKWCKQMEEKDKGDWSANEAGDYAKHCVFK
ncbi:DUF3012 domain-containing protein [Shewanella eurypsychrophilus]|uniref:DUF3012 domain-containing protein n=1 Tax=Shewanella eurypsychrophilus TaxID=2593656 RepID=A0ABX6V260_9GAMM|nr:MULTISPECIES: DUF3012 domain-containing protein [Shewanella]QFU21172.1 DUF3012 domain-containing protein [Shewanella sp. YLB-09]QPG56463.1 DUF3012 domain-containing protein [Shewanella eurypsychrophilus]